MDKQVHGELGIMVHYKDDFRRCCLGVVTQQVDGGRLNIQMIPNGPEQLQWRPSIAHGAGKQTWHWQNQCGMTDAEIKADDMAEVVSA